VARSLVSLPVALALLAPLSLAALGGPAAAQDEGARPQGENWRVDPRVTPGQGFALTTEGTVDGHSAVVERDVDLDRAELTIRYVLGDAEDPERSVEVTLRVAGVYVFEDDGDGKLEVSDRVVDHKRVVPGREAYVTPVRTSQPLSAAQAVVGLEDGGRVALTVTTSSHLSTMRGEDLSATETRLNLTVADLDANGDRSAAIALDASAPSVSQPADELVRLEGQGAGVSLSSMGAIAKDGGGATVLEQEGADEEQALVLLGGPSGPTSSHEAEAGVVHTSGALTEVQDAVQGEAGTFLLGLLASSALVGVTAWRKLRS
jgi:hypothetical protein